MPRTVKQKPPKRSTTPDAPAPPVPLVTVALAAIEIACGAAERTPLPDAWESLTAATHAATFFILTEPGLENVEAAYRAVTRARETLFARRVAQLKGRHLGLA
jgi:hypothetical protein